MMRRPTDRGSAGRTARAIGAGLFLLCLVTACAAPTEPSGDGSLPPGEIPLALDTPLRPSQVVRDEPLSPEAERSLERRMADLQVPGVSVAVIRDGEVAWARGYGLADVESGRPVTPDTLFQAASISKPIAAMGAVRLAQEGLVDLDADVNAVLTTWKVPQNEFTHPSDGEPRPVTLRDLLSHTAGMTVHGFPGYARSERVPSTVEVLDGAGNTDPIRVDMPPRTRRRYSGGGYTVAQQLMVDAVGDGSGFPAVMAARVLSPLGMADSTYEQPLPESWHGRAATAYLTDGSAVEGGWHVYPEMAAAGLWTTPSDLARFAIAVQRGAAGDDGPVLDAAHVQQMLTAPVEDGYGLGLGLPPGRFGHGGANAGFRCSLTAFVEGGDGAVVMTNSDAGGALANEILLTLFAHYGWSGMEPTERVVIAMTPEQLERYAGSYRIEGYGDVVVTVHERGDRLSFVLPDESDGVLRPETEERFFDPEDSQTLIFAIDADSGTVTGFRGPGFEATRSD